MLYLVLIIIGAVIVAGIGAFIYYRAEIAPYKEPKTQTSTKPAYSHK